MNIKMDYDHAGQLRAVYARDAYGRRDGGFREYYANGRLCEKGTYQQGLRDGDWIRFYDNGQLWLKCTYQITQEGQQILNGWYEEYFKNGQLCRKGLYQNGLLEGLYERYYRNGLPAEQRMHQNGQFHGPCKIYYDNGQLSLECTYKHNHLDGWCKTYFPEGGPESECLYQNGEIVQSTEYYRNGQVFRTRSYQNGVPDGEHTVYDEQGHIICRWCYADGKPLPEGVKVGQVRKRGAAMVRGQHERG